jgi:hypothetical protein
MSDTFRIALFAQLPCFCTKYCRKRCQSPANVQLLHETNKCCCCPKSTFFKCPKAVNFAAGFNNSNCEAHPHAGVELQGGGWLMVGDSQAPCVHCSSHLCTHTRSHACMRGRAAARMWPTHTSKRTHSARV